MATSITKTYTISVKYTKGNLETITASELNTVALRDHVKKMINQITKVQMGIYQGIRTTEVVET